MWTNAKRFLVAAYSGLSLIGIVGAAVAQNMPQPANPPMFRVNPDPRVQQAAANIALLGQAYSFVPPGLYGANQSPAVFYSPYLAPGGALLNNAFPYGAASLSSTGGYSSMSTSPGSSSSYSPYNYPYYYEDPVAGYLRGAADVIGNQSKFIMSREQAKLIREQASQARIDTRRKLFEEWQYEKSNTPTVQQVREQVQADDLRRSQTNPAQTEVWSGKALNDLLDHASRLQSKGMGPSIAVEEDILKHVNVSSGKGGNIGLLRNEGQLTWPQALRATVFDGERKQVEQLARDAVKQAQFGKVDAGTLQDLNGAVKRLHDQVAKQIFDLSPTQYIEATRYLKQLDDALKGLAQPDVADYFAQKLSAQGKNVAELVKHMANKGLRFAPAVAGDEPYYNALYNRLVQYDLALQNAVAEK